MLRSRLYDGRVRFLARTPCDIPFAITSGGVVVTGDNPLVYITSHVSWARMGEMKEHNTTARPTHLT